MTFAKRLDNAIRRSGVNASKIAERAGIDNGALSKLRHGKAKHPRAETVQKLAETLGVTYEWLSRGDGKPTPDIVGEDGTGFGEVVEVKAPIENVLERFPWPEDLEPADAETVMKRVRQDFFAVGENVTTEAYWFTRIRRLIAEVQGRAKSAPSRGGAELVDLMQESPEVRGARKSPRRR